MKNILVVDDSKAVHAYVKNCFKTLDVQLTHVFNGQEAVDILNQTQSVFDLILLDWEMPIMDGPTTFDLIKKNSVPVIMMTTKNSPQDIAFMLGKGVSEYILKPFTSDILVEKIKSVKGEEFANV